MHARRLALALGTVAAIAIVLAACGGGDGEPSTPTPGPDTTPQAAVTTPVAAGVTAIAENDDLAVGPNRFVFVLLDEGGLSIDGAGVDVSFYRITDAGPELAFEAPASQHTIQGWFPHRHEDGATHIHSEASAYYAVQADFDTAGSWGTQYAVTLAGASAPQTVRGSAFEVLAQSSTPSIGAPAPATDNPTVAEVADISEIDTSEPPRPELHTLSIADAVTAGKPAVVTFSSPAFCQSRLCGPVTEVVASLLPDYGGRVSFVHVEPYDLDLLRNEGRFVLTPWTAEWGLNTEPWTFVIDGGGTVVAKFNGVVSAEELSAALDAALAA